jgi:NNP family nitrate/nitrite transporter-like MFS transporter
LLGTVSFTVCFAAWGLISAFAPHFRQQFHLSATQTAFLVAVPVLLGALARIPIGMLADRFGGRTVFTVLMFFVAVPVALVPAATSYQNLLIVAFLLGIAGSSFAVGVGYVSRWFSIESQGSALGVYGLGNIGQSAALFLGPVVAAAYGYRAVYWGMSVILLVWTGVSSVPFPPQPPQQVAPPLFGWFTGITTQSDFSGACMSAVRFVAFADRP